MNLNKTGLNAKKGLGNLISRKFGIILKIGKGRAKTEQNAYMEQNFNGSRKHLKRALIEAEIGKSQATEYMRRIQNR